MQRRVILCFGRDLGLLSTRVSVLEAYYQVVAVSTLSHLEEQLRAEPFDLLLLCHSLDHKFCAGVENLLSLLQDHPPVLAMQTTSRGCEFDRSFSSAEGPKALLNVIAKILTERVPNHIGSTPTHSSS